MKGTYSGIGELYNGQAMHASAHETKGLVLACVVLTLVPRYLIRHIPP
jgi:hypothetical protein